MCSGICSEPSKPHYQHRKAVRQTWGTGKAAVPFVSLHATSYRGNNLAKRCCEHSPWALGIYMHWRIRAELIISGGTPSCLGKPHQEDAWLHAGDVFIFLFSPSAFLQKPESQNIPFLSEMILLEMLWIYADYFIPLLAVSAGSGYVSVCTVHKTWTICS